MTYAVGGSASSAVASAASELGTDGRSTKMFADVKDLYFSVTLSLAVTNGPAGVSARPTITFPSVVFGLLYRYHSTYFLVAGLYSKFLSVNVRKQRAPRGGGADDARLPVLADRPGGARHGVLGLDAPAGVGERRVGVHRDVVVVEAARAELHREAAVLLGLEALAVDDRLAVDAGARRVRGGARDVRPAGDPAAAHPVEAPAAVGLLEARDVPLRAAEE